MEVIRDSRQTLERLLVLDWHLADYGVVLSGAALQHSFNLMFGTLHLNSLRLVFIEIGL